VEFKRYLHRFMKEFTRIETLAGVKRTIFNQYDALERPLESWLAKQGGRFLKAFTVTNLDLTDVDGKLAVTGLTTSSPPPVPPSSKNLAFISQFVEIPEDVVFTVEYSVRVAQMAVYELLGITREIPPILHRDRSVKVQFDSILEAFR
jgi:myosin-crossreactive antigen